MKYILFIFSIAISSLTLAQEATVIGNINVQKDQQSNALIISQAENKSGKTQALSYSLQVNKYSPSGNTINTQSGSFTLLPNETKNLSQVSINIPKTANFEITLKIFDDQRILTEKKLNSDEKFYFYFSTLQPPIENKPSTLPLVKPKENKKAQLATDALEIDGLIIDETRSKSGRDFYDFFYNKWTAPRGAKDFTITVKELPARGRGARVAVEVNGNLLYQRFLQPRQDIIELMAEQTVNIIKKHLSDNEQLKQDLEIDDQKGSGIF